MHLLDLNDDVLLHTLCLSRVFNVLAASETCKRLHTLSFERQVWLALVQDLHARLFIDQPLGHLQRLSILELVSTIKRIVKGPRTWSASVPVIARQYILHPKIRLGPGSFERDHEAKLLPGGRYVLFTSTWSILECWNVAKGQLVWTHKSALGHIRVKHFTAEVVEHGKAAIILICSQDDRLPGVGHPNFAEFVYLDLASGSAHCLLHARSPSTFYRNDPICRSYISGDMAVIRTSSENRIFVVNWKTQSCLILLTSTHFYDIAFVNGYIIVVTKDTSSQTNHVTVLSTQLLAGNWSPIDHMEQWKSLWLKDIAGAMSKKIKYGPSLEGPDIYVHESPLQDGLYTIWIFVIADMIHEYTLRCPSTPSTEPPHLSLRLSLHSSRLYFPPAGISYSGHTEVHDYAARTRNILSLSEPTTTTEAETVEHGDLRLVNPSQYIHISAYSGALTYCTHAAIIINYYQ